MTDPGQSGFETLEKNCMDNGYVCVDQDTCAVFGDRQQPQTAGLLQVGVRVLRQSEELVQQPDQVIPLHTLNSLEVILKYKST